MFHRENQPHLRSRPLPLCQGVSQIAPLSTKLVGIHKMPMLGRPISHIGPVAQQGLTERGGELAAVDYDVVVTLLSPGGLPLPIMAALFIGLDVASGELGGVQRGQLLRIYRSSRMDVHPHWTRHCTVAQRLGLQPNLEQIARLWVQRARGIRRRQLPGRPQVLKVVLRGKWVPLHAIHGHSGLLFVPSFSESPHLAQHALEPSC